MGKQVQNSRYAQIISNDHWSKFPVSKQASYSRADRVLGSRVALCGGSAWAQGTVLLSLPWKTPARFTSQNSIPEI